MPLNAKPFVPAEKILKRVVLPSPAVYADVELNQMSDIEVETFKRISETLGSVASGFIPTLTFTWVSGDLSFTVDNPTTGKLFYKKVLFDIPTFSHSLPTTTIWPALSNGVGNFYLIATLENVPFSSDPILSGVDGLGLGTPLPGAEAVRYTGERVDFTIGADVLPTLGSGEEIIALLCQVAFKEDDTAFQGVTPYLQINTPDTSTLQNIFFPGAKYVSSKNVGVIPNVLKFIDYCKVRLDRLTSWLTTGVSDDFLHHNGTRYIPTNFSLMAFDRVRNYPHSYTRVQSWGRATATSFTSGTGTLTLPGTGNAFIGSWSGAPLKSIVFNDGGTDYFPPEGTVIYLSFSSNSIMAPATVSLDYSAGSFIYPGGLLAVPSLSVGSFDSMTLCLLYSGAGYWMLLGRSYEYDIQNLNTALSTETSNRISTDNTLFSMMLSVIGVNNTQDVRLTAIESSWVPFVGSWAGTNMVFNSDNLVRKKYGNMFYISGHVNVSFTATGTTYISLDTTSLFTRTSWPGFRQPISLHTPTDIFGKGIAVANTNQLFLYTDDVAGFSTSGPTTIYFNLCIPITS